MQFPENPTNGMIFETSPGIYYQYSSVTKSWFRVTTPSIPLATEFNDGLMSSEDFTKMTGLIVPPPQINLSFEDCDTEYSSGLIALTGDTSGIVQVEVRDEKLHENTGVIDFKLDTQKFAALLTSMGQLRLTAPQGDQGPRGDPGEDGVDSLPVGPQGEDGQPGKNAPWPGTLSEETFDVVQQSRAVVDIDVRKVSSEENYLIVRRANIGNPDACPDTIIPQDVQSPWLLALSIDPSGVVSTQIISPVTGVVCGYSCQSDLYYFDIEAIIQQIYTQFVTYLNTVKATKESLAEQWLEAMMELFNEQKSALCCALEACRSRGRNERTRQYIETQRIQAALGSFQLVVGSEEDKQYPPLDDEGECAWNIAPANYNLLHLSDPDCEVDWQALCPSAATQGWGPAHAFALEQPEKKAYVPDVSVSVMANDGAVADAASGMYTGGSVYEDDSVIQWAWRNPANSLWMLVVWYSKIDEKYAARLVETDAMKAFGIDNNVTAAFQAGQVIEISGLSHGQSFVIPGSGELAGGYATITVQ